MLHTFTELNLHEKLVQAVTDLGYTTPTPIQSAVIPLMLAGQDVVGQAKTGTGKTAAFALPIIQRLMSAQHDGNLQALILVPTRELALQVAQAIDAYSRYHRTETLAVYGGQPYNRQIHQIKQGVDIVVGTPGRLLDLINRRVLDLGGIRTVVLDEADEMLSMGFIEDIEVILNQTSSARQTALFSATLPHAIRALAERYLRHPQSVTIDDKQRTVATTEQRYYLVNEADKLAVLTRLFEVEEMSSALVFVRTRLGTGELASELSLRGIPVEVLNGDLSQSTREQVLLRFRCQQIKVLVATDVAARGLDIDGISHVFNYDLPQEPEAYVHRIGRTGRAGRTGLALSLVTPREQWRLRKIETYTKQKITPSAVPTEAEIQSYREAALLERMRVWLKRGRCSQERTLVARLTEEGHDAMEIAAAALKLARSEEKQRPIAPVSELQGFRSQDRKRDRKPGNGRHGQHRENNRPQDDMARLTLNVGRAHGIRPNDVVGSIAHYADIPGRSIGAIRIQEQHTLVEVPKQFVAQVLEKTRHVKIRQHAIRVTGS